MHSTNVKRFMKILAYVCLAILVIGMPYGMLKAMGESGYLDTGSPSVVLLATPTVAITRHLPQKEEHNLEEELNVTVIASTLEKRSKAGGGENVGYWQESDSITISWACVNQAGDVWIAFAGGWSAAKYKGREFVSPLPVVTEVCDE